LAKYGVPGSPEPDTYAEAYAALQETQKLNGQLFGTLDSIDGGRTPDPDAPRDSDTK
jgi:hypothetical protein